MSKKMKIPSIFKNKEAKQPWQWPSCNHPKTLSFRATNDDVFKTVNSVFLDPSDGLETPESWFTNSSECPSSSTDGHSEDNINNNNNNNNNNSSEESLEMIIRGVRSSERLFFEPGDTSSILKEAKTSSDDNLPFKESVVLAFESDNPYLDFKKSMHEMVESHGIKDWDCLEELLGWYLEMNGKMNHGFIVGAFVDLLIGLASDSSSDSLVTRLSCSESTSYSSADSSFSSPSSPLSPTLVVVGHEMGIDEERDVDIVQS